jgi:hypothetical protein
MIARATIAAVALATHSAVAHHSITPLALNARSAVAATARGVHATGATVAALAPAARGA